MSSRKPPRLLLSTLTDRVYISTSYKEMASGVIVSNTKFDVTDEFDAIAEQRAAMRLSMVDEEGDPR